MMKGVARTKRKARLIRSGKSKSKALQISSPSASSQARVGSEFFNTLQSLFQSDNVTRNRERAEDSQFQKRLARVLRFTRWLPAF
jgi:hypothetical protein